MSNLAHTALATSSPLTSPLEATRPVQPVRPRALAPAHEAPRPTQVQVDQDCLFTYSLKECVCCKQLIHFLSLEVTPVCILCSQNVIQCAFNAMRKTYALDTQNRESEQKIKTLTDKLMKVDQLQLLLQGERTKNLVAQQQNEILKRENDSLKVQMKNICDYYGTIDSRLKLSTQSNVELQSQLKEFEQFKLQLVEHQQQQLQRQLQQIHDMDMNQLKSTQPQFQPTQPQFQPTQPQFQPTQPQFQPTQPQFQPTQ